MTQSPKATTFNLGDLSAYSTDGGLPELTGDQPRAGERNGYGSARSKIGRRFNPWKRFNYLPVPEAMARSKDLPAGAKLVFGRLLRYAGENGQCWPAVDTLGEEVGLGERQTQKHLKTLEDQGFIRRVERFGEGGRQTSNGFEFLWHKVFEEWERDHPKRVN